MSRFESWTRGSLTGISSSRLAPRWFSLGIGVFLLLLVVAFGALRSGIVRGGLVLIGIYGLLIFFLRSWLIVIARSRLYLVSRSDLGDGVRFAILSAIVIGIPVLAGVIGVILLLSLDLLDRAARGG